MVQNDPIFEILSHLPDAYLNSRQFLRENARESSNFLHNLRVSETRKSFWILLIIIVNWSLFPVTKLVWVANPLEAGQKF